MSKQLNFDWPTRVVLEPDDYFVSAANAQAYAMVQSPESWPEGKLALVGPASSGKSHLARVFQQLANARLISASQLTDDVARTDVPALVVEDIETLAPESEETLFHLHNHMRQRRAPLLLTSSLPPSRWRIALPDLASRMQATTVVTIDDPDDKLLSAVLMKLFQDRQLAPKPEVITYLATRIERSFTAAAAIVEALDKAALTSGKPITIPLLRTLLDNEGEDG